MPSLIAGKEVPVLCRLAPMLLLALSVSAPFAQADSLGEAVNLSIGPSGAAALADMPPEALAALHSASSLLAARSQGLVSDRNAAVGLAALADQLDAARPHLDELDDEAYRIELILESRVLVAGARELVRTMPEGADRSELLRAMARLLDGVAASVDRRVHAGADGPDNPCFQQYGACMEHCSARTDFIERSLCGMDCNLDFTACLGTSVGRGIGALIGVFGDITRGGVPGPRR